MPDAVEVQRPLGVLRVGLRCLFCDAENTIISGLAQIEAEEVGRSASSQRQQRSNSHNKPHSKRGRRLLSSAARMSSSVNSASTASPNSHMYSIENHLFHISNISYARNSTELRGHMVAGIRTRFHGPLVLYALAFKRLPEPSGF